MFKRLLPAVLTLALLILPLRVAATDYTDIWYLPSESGWGVNLVQADNVIFATFFIYGPGNQPTWYTAVVYRDANGNFAGNLYANVGSYLGAPWDPTKFAATLVGTASFIPSSPHQGTLTYNLTGGPTVTKAIQRQTLRTIALGGNYAGGRVGSYAGGSCGTAGGYQDNFNLQVTQPDASTAMFQFSYGNGVNCALSGTLTQYGQLYAIFQATYQCSNGLNTTASMDQIQATALGIEGTYAAPAIGGGCSEAAAFLAVPVASSTSAAQNVAPVSVDAGPANIPNLPFVALTVCAPGSSTNCQTIDHIQLDTGSSGLRLIASVLSPALAAALPQQEDGSGDPLAECAQFADGFSWGAVKLVDLRIAGEQAASLPVQIIGDPALASIPSSCSSSGRPENTVDDFGANGLMGIGLFLQDCGAACAQAALAGFYYGCPASGCVPTELALVRQLQNPVGRFGVDNNGTIIVLSAVPAGGAASAAGSVIFGIGTQANNGLGSAKVLTTDLGTGYITTQFNGQSYATSYLDSGSSLLFIGSGLYPLCTGAAVGFYCPATLQNLSATLDGTNGSSSVASFSIGNADQLTGANPNFYAFDDLGAPGGDPSLFAWGLPFFYGRSIYTAIETRSTPGGTGPYFAF